VSCDGGTMKILDATFIVKAGERGTFVVEFCYSTAMVRVWNRGDFGDASAKPLFGRVNVNRRFKPCATHVAELIGLALLDAPAGLVKEAARKRA